jgi:hypothetical protein
MTAKDRGKLLHNMANLMTKYEGKVDVLIKIIN